MDRGVKAAIGTTIGLTALLVGCIDLLQEPASPPPAVLALRFVVSSDSSTDASQTSAAVLTDADSSSALVRAASGPTRAADGAKNESAPDFAPADGQRALQALFDDVDEVRVQILREEDVVQDTTVALATSEEEARIRIELDLRESSETLAVQVELLVEGLAALRGDALVNVEAGASAEVQIEPEPIPSGVSVPDSLELAEVGESLQLTGQVVSVTGEPIPELSLSWETLDPDVVEVTTNGLVTAVAPGAARVIGSHGELSDTANVSVRRSHTVVVEPDSITLLEGEDLQFSATVLDSQGETIADQPVTWSSSEPDVATVDEDGLVTALSVGSTVITAESEDVEDQANVTVTEEPVERIDVRPDSYEIVEGETVQLTATPQNAGGEPLPGRSVAWDSSDPDVATVDDSGLVTGIATGEARIRATSEEVSSEAYVAVTPVLPERVIVEPSADTLEVDSTRRFTATTLDSDGNPLDGRPISWSSSDGDVATVDDDGLVRALAPGETTIRASSGGVSDEAQVAVVPRPVDRVVVEPSRASIEVGEEQQFTATPVDSDGNPLTGREVRWAALDADTIGTVARVDDTGLVTGIAVGDATIHATVEGVSGDATVVVRQVPVVDVTVESESVEVFVERTVQLTATPRDANSRPLPDRPVTWTSSDTRIATVSETGLVTGVATGTAVIRASSGDAFGEAIVEVPQARISGIVHSPAGIGRPIADAIVELLGPGPSAPRRFRTGQNGRYLFSELEPGFYTVRGSKPGFHTIKIGLDLGSGRDRLIHVRLSPITLNRGSPSAPRSVEHHGRAAQGQRGTR